MCAAATQTWSATWLRTVSVGGTVHTFTPQEIPHPALPPAPLCKHGLYIIERTSWPSSLCNTSSTLTFPFSCLMFVQHGHGPSFHPHQPPLRLLSRQSAKHCQPQPLSVPVYHILYPRIPFLINHAQPPTPIPRPVPQAAGRCQLHLLAIIPSRQSCLLLLPHTAPCPTPSPPLHRSMPQAAGHCQPHLLALITARHPWGLPLLLLPHMTPCPTPSPPLHRPVPQAAGHCKSHLLALIPSRHLWGLPLLLVRARNQHEAPSSGHSSQGG